MNKIYRTVWNAASHTWTAASEAARSRSKGSTRAALSVVGVVVTLGIPLGAGAANVVVGNATATSGSYDAVAIGEGASAVNKSGSAGTNAPIAIGYSATTGGGWGAIAIGGGASTADSAAGEIAIGRNSSSSGTDALAIGDGAKASVSQSVAIGGNSVADRSNTVSVGSTTNQRQIVNVAAGTQSTDAVNLSQLTKTAQSVATALGGGATVNAAGAISSPTYDVAGGTQTSIGAALSALNTAAVQFNGTGGAVDVLGNKVLNVAAGDLSASSTDAVNGAQLYATNQNVTNVTNTVDGITNGGGIKYFHTNSTLADSSATGGDAVAIGGNAKASALNSVALGSGSTTTADLAAAGYNPGSTALSGTASATNGEVSMGSSGKERRVTNVAAGSTATDAVNVSQLQSEAAKSTLLGQNAATALGGGSTYDATTGALSAPTYSVAGGTQTSIAAALSALDAAAVQFNGTDGAVDVAGKKILNVAAGDLSASSTDAVNGSQLFATNARLTTAEGNIAQNTSDIAGNTAAIAGLNGRLGTAESNIANNTSAINSINGRVTNVEGSVTNLTQQLSNGEVGLVQQDATTQDITVASDKAGTSVDFSGTQGPRKLSGVAAGGLSDASTDAVNGSQLFATNTRVTAAESNIAQNTSDIAGNTAAIAGLNGRFDTAESNIANNTSTINSINGRVTNVEGSVTNLTQQLSNGEVGLVQQDATTHDITVASDKAGTLVNMAGTAGNRALTGVANGAVSAASVDAINGSQLYAMASSTAAGLGGEAKVNADGTISAPSYSVGGATVHNVGDAVTNLDGRVAQNTTDIANLSTQLNTQLSNGEVGLVKQNTTTNAITVASDKTGTSVNFTGTQGPRTLSGVATGSVSPTSAEAINGGQLYAMASSTAAGLGGEAKVNADGTISAPSYSVGGTMVHNVGDAVTNLDGRVTQNTTDITNLSTQLSNGEVGLVQQDTTTHNITVASDKPGTSVDFSGTQGPRTLSGVATGSVSPTSTEAINGSQLYATASSTAAGLGGEAKVNADGTISAPSYSVGGTTVHNVGDAVTNLDGRVTQNTTDITEMQNQLIDVGTKVSGAVQYDRNNDGSVNFNSVTLGGGQSAGPVVLTNVANGTSQYDAVNFGQLSALQDHVSDLDAKVANLLPGSPYISATGVPDASGVVNNAASSAKGEGGTAVGVSAVASGNDATAIGAGAQADNANSVALGRGSVTDRDNSVSIGSSTQQRQVTNVAAGTADTDAVNLGQLNNSVSQGVQQANSYTDQRFNDANRAINDVARNAYAGIAAAMAMPNMTPSGPGRTIVAAGAANYKGGNAVAAGATYRSRNGNWLVNGAVSVTNTGDAGVRAQVGYEF